jgi:hypothetical protein
MPNTFEYVDWLTMDSMRILKNELVIAKMFNTSYNKEFTKEFPVGSTVRVPLPQRFTIRDGLAYSAQPIAARHVDVTVDQFFGVDFEWDSAEKALQMVRGEELVRERYIQPAMEQIAQEIESRCALWATRNTNNFLGTLGVNPTAMQTYNQGRARMVELACPAGEKSMIISPQMQVSLGNAVSAVFNPAPVISDIFKRGALLGTGAGFTFVESPSLYTHTSGVWTAGATVTSAVAAAPGGVSSILITATALDTFLVGDVFTLSAVNAVNPGTRRTTSQLKQFRVTQLLTAAGGGADSLAFSPAIFGPGSQYQNVDAMPAGGSTISLFGDSTPAAALTGINGLGLHKNAFALVGVPLEVPKKAELASQTRDPQTGIAIRFIRDWNQLTSQMQNRFDVLIGFGNLYADECAVRIGSLT